MNNPLISFLAHGAATVEKQGGQMAAMGQAALAPLRTAGGAIGGAASGLWEGAKNSAKSLYNVPMGAARLAGNTVTAPFRIGYGALHGRGTEAAHEVGGDMWDSTKQLGKGSWQALNGVWNPVSAAVQSGIGATEGFAGGMSDSIKAMRAAQQDTPESAAPAPAAAPKPEAPNIIEPTEAPKAFQQGQSLVPWLKMNPQGTGQMLNAMGPAAGAGVLALGDPNGVQGLFQGRPGGSAGAAPAAAKPSLGQQVAQSSKLVGRGAAPASTAQTSWTIE